MSRLITNRANKCSKPKQWLWLRTESGGRSIIKNCPKPQQDTGAEKCSGGETVVVCGWSFHPLILIRPNMLVAHRRLNVTRSTFNVNTWLWRFDIQHERNTVMTKRIMYNIWSWISCSVTSAVQSVIQSGCSTRWLLSRKLAQTWQTPYAAIWLLQDGLRCCSWREEGKKGGRVRSHDLCPQLMRKDLSASLDQKTVMVKPAAVVDWQDEIHCHPETFQPFILIFRWLITRATLL